MKVALLTYFLRLRDYPTRYSLAALRLGEYLNSCGIDVDLLPIPLVDLDLKKFVEESIKDKYDIVGISNYVWSKDITPQIAKIIRDTAPLVSTVIGGPETQYTDLSLYENEIFILGEGEKSLVKVIKYLEDGKSDIDFFKNNENIFDKQHPDKQFIEEKLEYKSPLFTKFRDIDKDFLYYETTRGCGYKCGYCGFRNRKNVQFFDLNFIEEEIQRIGRMNFKEVFIVDANLGGIPERAKKILQMFNIFASKSKLTIYLRPEFIDDEMINLLKDANLKEVRIGIQTINKEIPNWIRSNSLEKINIELPKLSKFNIPWKAEFIIGLPGDTINGLKESLDFAENILKPTEICCYPLTVIKDTPMFELVNSNNENWIKIDEKSRAYESFSYTHKELEEMQMYAKLRMNKYLSEKSGLTEEIKNKKILSNKNIYKDVR